LHSLLRSVLGIRRFRIVATASWFGYWFLYSISSGMFFYYPFDVTPLLQKYQVANPAFVNYFSGFFGFYDSGIIWYPDGHLQVNLIYGPFAFSLVLATLFSLNIAFALFSLTFVQIKRAAVSVGALALIPALFSGGCCSVPLGVALFGVLAPASGLFTLAYDYSYAVDFAVALLMLSSLVFLGKKVARCCCAPTGKSRIP
jgi:hypothetical protein